MALDSAIRTYYDLGREAARLSGGSGRLDRLRTQDILGWLLPPRPRGYSTSAADRAQWLAGLGHDVRLIDPVPLHVSHLLTCARV